MTISLQLLFEEINQVKDKHDLSQLAPRIGEYFAAKRSGIFFFEELLADRNLQKVLEVALSVVHNPVARYLADAVGEVKKCLFWVIQFGNKEL